MGHDSIVPAMQEPKTALITLGITSESRCCFAHIITLVQRNATHRFLCNDWPRVTTPHVCFDEGVVLLGAIPYHLQLRMYLDSRSSLPISELSQSSSSMRANMGMDGEDRDRDILFPLSS
jgi:hypothetical protein